MRSRPLASVMALVVATRYGTFLASSTMTVVGCASAKAAGGSDAGVETTTEAGACIISASNYDRSCSTNSDCVAYIYGDGGLEFLNGLPVEFGNYCVPGCVCGGDAINRRAVAQYVNDVLKTPSLREDLTCNCSVRVRPAVDSGEPGGACCLNGTCSTTSCPAL
jgi:hypothetical protein